MHDWLAGREMVVWTHMWRATAQEAGRRGRGRMPQVPLLAYQEAGVSRYLADAV